MRQITSANQNKGRPNIVVFTSIDSKEWYAQSIKGGTLFIPNVINLYNGPNKMDVQRR